MMPPRRVLAAVDYLPQSRAALVFAARLATHCGAELHLLHAVAPHAIETRRTEGCRHLRQKLDALLRSAVATPPAVVRSHLVEGNPGDVIVHIAARESADVIVLGASDRLDPSAPGTTLDGVLRRSPVPVFVVPPHWSPPDPDRNDLQGLGPVLAGLNLTCPAIEAALAACRLANAVMADVTLLHATNQKNGNTEDIERVVESLRVRTMTPVQLVVAPGDVAHLLARHAGQHPHSIIVLGRAVGAHADMHPCAIATRTLSLCHQPLLLHTSEPPRPD
jgi:nucleotide-binding universal stress UspA family protein